ncbi:hypothetical protein RSAG8_02186, partial [Rhizoctonia solani AG-8 WAC10335]
MGVRKTGVRPRGEARGAGGHPLHFKLVTTWPVVLYSCLTATGDKISLPGTSSIPSLSYFIVLSFYFAFSPVGGEVLRKRGYKFTIIMGLTLLGWCGPLLAVYRIRRRKKQESNIRRFCSQVTCTAVIVCGLASLETAANSYITCLPGAEPSGAVFRLQLSQSFDGIASFAGPFIASKYFSGGNATNLTNVQWVYLAVALMDAFIAFLFTVTKLPETYEAELEEQVQAAAEVSGMDATTDQPFYKQSRGFFGWLSQFMYVDAQVSIGSFFIDYGAEVVGSSDAKASNFLSYALIMFTIVHRMLRLITCTTFLHGKAGMACLMTGMFFQAPLFPCIFIIPTTVPQPNPFLLLSPPE